MKTCSEVRGKVLEEALSALPETQQAALKACLTASKIKNPKNMRYTTQWIYECILLRIKSKKTYEHLRTHKVLALPCVETLNKYIQNVKGAYGFQPNIFKAMSMKCESMEPQELRGNIQEVLI